VALRLNAILIRRDVYALWSTELVGRAFPSAGRTLWLRTRFALAMRPPRTSAGHQSHAATSDSHSVRKVGYLRRRILGYQRRPVQAVVLGAAGSQVLAVGSRVDSREAIFLLYLFQPALAGPTIPVQTEMAGSNDDRQDGEDEDAARNMVHTFSIP
jgi:hypothetical protein